MIPHDGSYTCGIHEAATVETSSNNALSSASIHGLCNQHVAGPLVTRKKCLLTASRHPADAAKAFEFIKHLSPPNYSLLGLN